jgi:Sulfatase
MTNWWPTPYVKLDARIAPEFVYVWCGVLFWVFLVQRGTVSAISRRGITLLSLFYLLLMLGRYLDTTAPALFGRAINLYWDGWQVPRLLWVMSKNQPLWVPVLIILAISALLVFAYAAIRWALQTSIVIIAPFTLARRWALGTTGLLLVVSIANLLGVRATWPYISRPVIPTYWQQAKILTAALQNGGTVVPPSPPFTSDLARLKGADFKLFFMESYGAVTYDNLEVASALAPSRAALETQIGASGRRVVSAFVTSTTFGGGTDLAHMALATGIDTRDPIRHDVLLTTQRPTLMRQFKARGYETFGFYPGLDWDWPESSFFGFDRLVDGRALGYVGPKLGYWKIPDQFALARFRQLHPTTANSPPRMLFFSSTTSHFPFHPVPPYQPDWQRVLTSTPYDSNAIARIEKSQTDWLNLLPGYVGMIDYNFQWLRGYLEQDHARDFVMLVLGDHQPPSSVTGEGVSWDVPVHIISSREDLIRRFESLGFTRGLHPSRKPLGSLADVTTWLLDAFDSQKADARLATP